MISPNDQVSPDGTEDTLNENDITEQEKYLLDNAGDAEEDDAALSKSILENTDEDGEELNVSSNDLSGEDLDVPGASADDDNEDIGSEDEENNSYSLSDNQD